MATASSKDGSSDFSLENKDGFSMLHFFSNANTHVFESLPKELLIYLLDMLDSPKDVMNVSLVCKKWRDVSEKLRILNFFSVQSVNQLRDLLKANREHAKLIYQKKSTKEGINFYMLGLREGDACCATAIPVAASMRMKDDEFNTKIFLSSHCKVSDYFLSAWHFSESKASHEINKFLEASKKCGGNIIALAYVKTKKEVASYQAKINNSMLLFCFTEDKSLSQMFANTILIDPNLDSSVFYQAVISKVEKMANVTEKLENPLAWRCSIL